MTEEAPATETADPAQPETTPEPPQPEETAGADKPGNEAARYRRQLRDTEAERDQLRERLDTHLRTEAERLSRLDKPAALWAAGVELADVLDDAGFVDPAKVTAATLAARNKLGLLGEVDPPIFRSPGADREGDLPTPTSSWADVLRG